MCAIPQVAFSFTSAATAKTLIWGQCAHTGFRPQQNCSGCRDLLKIQPSIPINTPEHQNCLFILILCAMIICSLGFPKGFRLRQSHHCEPDIVLQLLKKELDKGYLIGSFNSLQFPVFQTSPIGATIEYSVKKRLIFNLSVHRSGSIARVNSLIPPELFLFIIPPLRTLSSSLSLLIRAHGFPKPICFQSRSKTSFAVASLRFKMRIQTVFCSVPYVLAVKAVLPFLIKFPSPSPSSPSYSPSWLLIDTHKDKSGSLLSKLKHVRSFRRSPLSRKNYWSDYSPWVPGHYTGHFRHGSCNFLSLTI